MTATENTQPRKRRTNLVETLTSTLRGLILNGSVQVGEKLPSEAELTSAYKVSRTVVREAIASLRSDGLAEARQGAGVFVIRQTMPSDGMLKSFDLNKISSIIEMLELRTAVEVEAAALAAKRRSPAQEGAILESHKEMEELIRQGASTAEADYAFHQAIAAATNNPRFVEFLDLMGGRVIPRKQLSPSEGEAATGRYLQQIVLEHGKIARAISDQDEDGARAAMRQHLKGGGDRYRELLR
ncbi:FadR/GntR family transcriptional regulator [Parasedimentitalea psychrophila]|uniref:FadR/GntR family transcriptional regulator n=1 Tax=Parasedimentitalea psychrophila TaxID=2997337 RepID=A0A9Y2L1S9_9RHOB|nr:FadR/GntR family transcriptional regulator [Parasedimentitalea psychrophila]WIY26573.1 FadR/GntR family transcriptional regulator [Parasedimentitalea psychrophila]